MAESRCGWSRTVFGLESPQAARHDRVRGRDTRQHDACAKGHRAIHVATTLAGTAAVFCVFGPRATSEAPFCARATTRVIAAMEAAGIRRLVCLTGAMVGELPANVSRPMRFLAGLYRRQVPGLAADAAEQERLVMASGLDWTIAKPPRLTDAPPRGRVRADPALRVGLLSRISRGDLAAFLMDEAVLVRHLRKRVYVSG